MLTQLMLFKIIFNIKLEIIGLKLVQLLLLKVKLKKNSNSC
jgi:hypothetical protein